VLAPAAIPAFSSQLIPKELLGGAKRLRDWAGHAVLQGLDTTERTALTPAIKDRSRTLHPIETGTFLEPRQCSSASGSASNSF
jgi:hypothetical protein